MTTLLVLDLDGVVSPIHPVGPVWGDEILSAIVFGPVTVSPTLVERLDALGATPGVVPIWLTSWSPLMREQATLLPGRQWASIEREHVDAAASTWWKLGGLIEWITAHGGVDAVVWIDDDLPPSVHTDDLTTDDVREALHAAGVRRVHLFAPRSEVGIDPAMMEAIEEAVRRSQRS